VLVQVTRGTCVQGLEGDKKGVGPLSTTMQGGEGLYQEEIRGKKRGSVPKRGGGEKQSGKRG